MIKIEGIDKQLVGIVAAKIRSFRPPEPYKGKGVRYKGEYVRSKQGKTVGLNKIWGIINLQSEEKKEEEIEVKKLRSLTLVEID